MVRSRLSTTDGSNRLCIFDLGDTLVEYAGVPLNWERHYPEALAALAAQWGVRPTSSGIEAGTAVLRRHNTRLSPRVFEVSFDAICAELAEALGASGCGGGLESARAFFGVFRRRLSAFADAVPTLSQLRGRGCPIAVLTDVPYGMPRILVEGDLLETGLTGLVDRLLTSAEAGCRKPGPDGLLRLVTEAGVPPSHAMYVGNECKDIEAARAAGITSVLLDRGNRAPGWGEDVRIRTLTELLAPGALTTA